MCFARNPVRDVLFAQPPAVWIPYVKPFPTNCTQPDHTIEALGELPELLAHLNATV